MKYKLKIKVLSPIHIGNGLEYYPSNVIIQEGHLIKVNMSKLYNNLNDNLKNEFEEYMMSDSPKKELRTFLKQYNIREFSKEYKLKYYAKPENNNSNSNQNKNPNQIYRNIKYLESMKDSKNNFYIPGSSLKGAIRTAIIYKRLKEMNNYKRYLKNLNEKQEKEIVFHGRELIISDSSSTNIAAMRQENNIGMVKKNNDNNKVKGIKNFCETIEPNQELEAFLTIIEKEEQNMEPLKEEQKNIDRLTFEELKKAIFEFTNDYLDFLSEKVKNYQKLPLQVQELKNINTENEPLLCIGRFKGYFANSVGLIYKRDFNSYNQILLKIPSPNKKKHDPKTFPISLNIFYDVENNQEKMILPGWIKLKFEEIKN
ncbi:MAG: type III-A CRISPR-associated RAMP protein Csm5 [Candidatus Woesearchaeota archaeon]